MPLARSGRPNRPCAVDQYFACPTRNSYVQKPNSCASSAVTPDGSGSTKNVPCVPPLFAIAGISLVIADKPDWSGTCPGKIARIGSGSTGRGGSTDSGSIPSGLGVGASS